MPHLATKIYNKGEKISRGDMKKEEFLTPLPIPLVSGDELF